MTSQSGIRTGSYWFSQSAEEIASYLAQNHQNIYNYGTNPIAQSWMRNSIAYFSPVLEPSDWTSGLSYQGDQGELIKMAVPQARSLMRQMVSLVTKQRLSFDAIAESMGSDVSAETKIGKSLSVQIVQQQKLDLKNEKVAEQAGVMGIGFWKVTWRTDRGRPYALNAPDNVTGHPGDPDSGQDHLRPEDGEAPPKIVYDGDLEITTPSVYDLNFDSRLEDWEMNDWVECRTIKNRWDLICQMPHLQDAIMALPKIETNSAYYTGQRIAISQDDTVYVYEVYHKPTPTLPAGRMVVYSDPNTIYYDGPNPYECIPIIPVKPENMFGNGYGYPKFSDLLPAQEMLDHSLSAIATNQAACAVQQIAVPRDADISVQDIEGLNFILFTPQNVKGGGLPVPLQLTQSAPETFKFADMLMQHMRDISNINSAIRGAPPAGVTSGTAIATLTANALEFLNSFSKSVNIALEEVMTLSIKCYQKFAKAPHLLLIEGKNSQAFQKTFTGDHLKSIHRMKLVVGNPLMQTLAGRVDTADKLLNTGLIKSPREYLSIVDGADLDQLDKTEVSENDLIQSENDALMEGEDVLTLITDDHVGHIREHKALLNDPMVRKNNPNVKKITDHILEHQSQLDQLQNENPRLLAILQTGQMPQIPPPPPPGAPQMPQPPGPPGAPPGAQMGAPPPAGMPPKPSGPVGQMPGAAGGTPTSRPAAPARDLMAQSRPMGA